MNEFMIEVYKELFLDSFFHGTLLPFQGELVFKTMLAFGGYDVVHIFVSALIASTLGFFVNWFVGFVLVKMYEMEPGFSENMQMRYDMVSGVFNRFGGILLLFSWVFVYGQIITLIAGLLQMDIRRFLLFTVLGRAAYYGYSIFI